MERIGGRRGRQRISSILQMPANSPALIWFRIFCWKLKLCLLETGRSFRKTLRFLLSKMAFSEINNFYHIFHPVDPTIWILMLFFCLMEVFTKGSEEPVWFIFCQSYLWKIFEGIIDTLFFNKIIGITLKIWKNKSNLSKNKNLTSNYLKN